jgi:superfamily II DNA or RNA helicase
VISLFENATHLIVTGEPQELETISDNLRFRPDGYFYNDRYTRFRITGGREGWDGWSYPFKVTGTSAKCLRGHRDQIIALCKLHGIGMNLAKLLPRPFADLAIEDVRPDLIEGKFQLDYNQRKAIQQWLVHCMGIAELPVGAGKTAAFAGAAALLKEKHPDCRILYIAQAERLVNQAFGDITKFCPHLNITQFGGGKKDNTGKDMVIATPAMLNKHFNRLVMDRWFKTFMAVFYDEVHHATADTSEKVLSEVPAFYRFGATGSPQDDKDQKQLKMIGLFGPFRMEATAHEYIEGSEHIQKGRQARPHIYLIDVPHWYNKYQDVPHVPQPSTPAFVLQDGVWTKGTYLGPVYELGRDGKPKIKKKRTLDENKQWITVEEPVTVPGLHHVQLGPDKLEIESRWVLLHRTYDRAITRFQERNDLIVQWTKYFSETYGQTLVVCTRTLHIYILEALIKQAVDDPDLVQILFSKDTSAQRDEAFEWFKSTKGAVLITPLVKEGVSINEIRAGVIADYVADFDSATQIVGRFVRPKRDGDNRAHIAWFVDNQVPTYRRGCNSLFRQLERVRGYTFYHPCTTPESIQPELCYDGREIPDLDKYFAPRPKAA